jgi:hypothetical protein
MLMMTEPTILSCFSLCWPLRLILVSNCVGPAYEGLGIIAARMSLVLVNFGFWIGSLLGRPSGRELAGCQQVTVDGTRGLEKPLSMCRTEFS